MIVLAFVACLDTAPDQCRDYNLTFADEITPMTCMMQAQTVLAQWGERHPDWRIGQWKCQHSSQIAQKA